MKLIALLSLLFLPGCALMAARQMTSSDAMEAVKLMEAQGGSGCVWLRGSGKPPGGDVALDVVATFGKGTSYEVCVRTIRVP